MTTNIEMNPSPHSQRGAVLVVSLLLLLVMTVLALGASQATRMQERMAGNLRDHDLAFQAAEAGLRAGERVVDDATLTAAPITCSKAPCTVWELGVLSGQYGFQPDTWWVANGKDYAGSAMMSGTGLAKKDPKYLIEEVEEVTDTLTVPPTGPPPSRLYYRITSRGQGGTESAEVVLQTTFARRFN